MNNHRVTFAAMWVLFSAACSSQTGQPESEATYRSFKRIAGAIAIGVNKSRYDELLQDASTQLLILADVAIDSEDSVLLVRYLAVLTKYKDADALWAEQVNNAKYSFIPEGRIYLTPAVENVARRYNLKIEQTSSSGGSTHFQSVATSGIQNIWDQALADERTADSVFLKQRH